MLEKTLDHLLHNVLAAAAEYHAAEQALTLAYSSDPAPAAWEAAARTAKRRAADVAIAIDGLTDRGTTELGRRPKATIRSDISALCLYPGSGAPRLGAHDRVRGVANAYKHQSLTDASLPITSEADVLVVGLGYGLDGWGVGKPGFVEVLVEEKSGERFKFLGDVPTAIAAWFKYLAANGATLPAGPFVIGNLQVHP